VRLRRRSPLVTVVIPTWNWSSVLPWSIASVRAQTMADLELLVIGDGCTDDSADVVAAARGGDRRVRWINLATNAGTQVAPNNEGLRRARGTFIAYLGHDDLWLPSHLERLVAAMGSDGQWGHRRWLQVDPGHPPFALRHEGWSYTPGELLAPTAGAARRGPARDWRLAASAGHRFARSRERAVGAAARAPRAAAEHGGRDLPEASGGLPARDLCPTARRRAAGLVRGHRGPPRPGGLPAGRAGSGATSRTGGTAAGGPHRPGGQRPRTSPRPPWVEGLPPVTDQ
jgi:hypothetical protein